MSAHPKVWMPDEDARLHEGYKAGLSWDEIAARLHVSRFAAVARAQRLGFIRKAPPKPEDIPLAPRLLTGRQCLPAGHPETWCPIVRGTLLEGVAFPA